MAEQIKQDTVLVVDDESNNRLLLKTYLINAGYQVRLAKDGQEAFQILRNDLPDIIILDIMLPNMSGYEVCQRIKSNKTTAIIPIILVTALRGTEERLQGIEVGADDFINKPFNRMELIIRVKSLLRIKKLNDALELKIKELEKAQAKMRQLAITDGLTGLYNYRYFRRQLQHEVSRAHRLNMPLSLLIMDIDFFKVYNDRFGHVNGDKILMQFSKLLYNSVREIDCLARYGGEEFVLILPSTDKKSAVIVAEKLRTKIENEYFPLAQKLPAGRVTMSVGVASIPEDTDDLEDLIKLTDKALYQAKNSGRNRTVAISKDSIQ